MAKKKWVGFKNFDKTYKRYVRDYYRKARMIYRRKHGYKANSRLPSSVTKEDLRKVMKDKTVLPRATFAEYYKSYKRDLISDDSTSDPTQYIVSHQAYEFTTEQYKGFKKALSERNQNDKFIQDLEGIKLYEFRTGAWRTEQFFESADAYYWRMKEEGAEMGITDSKELWMYAKKQVAMLYFGSE